MTRTILAAIALAALSSMASAQTPPAAPSKADQLQEMLANSSGELEVTRILLARSQQEFAAERSMSLRRASTIDALQHKLTDQDAAIKDLTTKLDEAKKTTAPAEPAKP